MGCKPFLLKNYKQHFMKELHKDKKKYNFILKG